MLNTAEISVEVGDAQLVCTVSKFEMFSHVSEPIDKNDSHSLIDFFLIIFV